MERRRATRATARARAKDGPSQSRRLDQIKMIGLAPVFLFGDLSTSARIQFVLPINGSYLSCANRESQRYEAETCGSNALSITRLTLDTYAVLLKLLSTWNLGLPEAAKRYR